MNKQTALDWFVDQLPVRILNMYQEEIVKARAREREQIKDAFGVGCQVGSSKLIGYHEMSEQYYNETYGGEQ